MEDARIISLPVKEEGGRGPKKSLDSARQLVEPETPEEKEEEEEEEISPEFEI